MSVTGNSNAGFEDRRWAQDSQNVEFRHRMALSLVPESVSNLLDVGCGDGTFLSLVYGRYPGMRCTGIDFSSVGLESARMRNPQATFSLVDMNTNFPFKDGSFDMVSALDVLEHTLEPERLLREIKRVSRTYVLLSVPNFSSLPARIQALRGSVPENNRPNKGHMYWFTRQVLHQLLQDQGFSIEREISNHQLQSRPFIGPVMHMAHEAFPSLLALSFVVLAKKSA